MTIRPAIPSGDDAARPEIPTLAAYDTGKSLAVWCAHCRRWHSHGRGDGHRAAHCIKPDSPYGRTGYVIRHAGPATAAMLTDMKRRRPQGLEARP